uniref:uncharacterized protein LOC129125880 n=1 Tax=Agelaius phoeniceus TaxID=39638 RepID=UPI0023ED5567|nr:uncharacterized protein LOC129125880 [Agelaius phoeniceus]XP_054497528.1 uncharacterized protein LOC129125880 [Agelaius phoeniceus]XP_054497529.1 uncharacterized protein LOC129125880 [Agelaius phoeniceus]XP_054497530.1 uncharacterized protein LOC129125880 [Agelaius phoeniceus]XP_054497531.1 uncharacterized protein LOC129125880 [Agelaius phoeniceus]
MIGRVTKGQGRSSGRSVPAIQSVLCAVLSPPGLSWPHGCSCRAGCQQPGPIPAQAGCCRRCDPGIHTWWHLRAKRSIGLSSPPVPSSSALLLPPVVRSPGIPELVLPKPPLPSRERTPYCSCRASFAFPAGQTPVAALGPAPGPACVPLEARRARRSPDVGQLRTASAPPVPARQRRTGTAGAGRRRHRGREGAAGGTGTLAERREEGGEETAGAGQESRPCRSAENVCPLVRVPAGRLSVRVSVGPRARCSLCPFPTGRAPGPAQATRGR